MASFLGGEKCGMEKSDSSPPSSTRLFNSIICALTQTHEFSEREERGKFVPGNEMKEKKVVDFYAEKKLIFFSFPSLISELKRDLFQPFLRPSNSLSNRTNKRKKRSVDDD